MAVGSNNGFQELELSEVVDHDSFDFGAWTTLISTVESMYHDDIDKISLLYDSFLSEFPLCYGYWKKYAEHHARLSSVENIVQVFERAVESVPYSVGVWVDYCSFSISSFEDPSDVCRLFERGLSFVGRDYLCSLLWDKYIEFEYSQQHWSSLANIYIQTLKFPTKKLHQYYESFKKLVSIWEEETGFQESSHTGLQSKPESNGEIMMSDDAEISHLVNDLLDPSTRTKALQKYIFIGESFYGKACDLDAKVQKFEKNIRRPYFHVKPLDDCQLQNWHEYLDFIEMEGDFDWAVRLYERCLISCAHYPEFWMRYVDFVESKGGKEIATDALHRATDIFLKNSSGIHLFNAWFKEKTGDIDGAHAAFLQCDQDIGSHFIDMVSRKANMENRLGNYAGASQIYTEALDLAAAKRPDALPMLYVHYARLQCKTNSVDAAREVLLRGIECVPQSKLLLKELLRFSLMHNGAKQVDLFDSIIARALSSGSDVSGALSTKDWEEISTLYMEYVDSCGSIHDIRTAWNRHLKLFPHLFRVQPSLKKSTKAVAVLKMIAEGRPDFFNPHFQKTSGDDDGNQSIQLPQPEENIAVVENVDKSRQTMNGQTQFEHGDECLDGFDMEHSAVSKSPIKDEGKANELGGSMASNADNINSTEAVEDCRSNGIQTEQELMAQQDKPTSQENLSLKPQNDESPYINGSKASGVEAREEASLPHRSSPVGDRDIKKIHTMSSPDYPPDKDAAETGNESHSPSFTQRRKDFSPAVSPTRRSDREGSQHRFNSSSKGRSEVGSPGNSGEQLERSLSPRRRSSHGYSDGRHYRQRSLSPRRHNSRWQSEERWQRDRRQRRHPRYQDNPRGYRDGRMQNQHILIVGNRGQSHNGHQPVVDSGSQTQPPVQSVVYPQAQINQYPLPSNAQYGDVQNSQLYNQMWQYYYQQQQLLQQQPVGLQQQPQQTQPPQQLQQQVQNSVQQQNMPTQQAPQPVVLNQQQLLQLHYQQQQLYQQSQLQQQQTNEQSQSHQQQKQLQLPQQPYQDPQLQQQEPQQQVQVQQQQQSQLQQLQPQPQMQQQQPQLQQQQSQPQQQEVYLQQQQSYQYQQLQQQQYLLYLQQLHQYQLSQQQSGLVQGQKLFQNQVESSEKQEDQKLAELHHGNEKLLPQNNDDRESIKGSHQQNQGIVHHASTSGAVGQLNSQDQLLEIEGTDM